MVSVIVPNYNYRRFLRKRLSSIASQTYRDMEIIFLDDGSRDGSVEFTRRFLEKCGIKYRIEINTQNYGSVSAQWQKGISLAKGEYIWIAEADDSCRNNFLERLTSVMDSNPALGMAYCGSTVINENDRVVDEKFYNVLYSGISEKKWQTDYTSSGHEEISSALFIMNTVPNASAVLIRRSVIKKHPANYNGFALSGDWLTYITILEHSDIAFIAENLNYNRLHKKRVTASLDISEVYFNESLRIAAYLNARYDIPELSRKKYVLNFLRQLVHARGKVPLAGEYYRRLVDIFEREIVDEAFLEYFNKLINGAEKTDTLWSRIKRITPEKVLKRCMREKI